MNRPARLLATLAALAAIAADAAPAPAQVATGVAPAQGWSDRGWIGVSIEILTTAVEGGLRRSARITDVREGGPAFRAGIRPGDVLVEVDGRSFLPEDMRPGQTVHLLLRRDGSLQEVDVTAEPRPAEVTTRPTLTLTFRADSMADRMFRQMDSLRVSLLRRGPEGVRVVDARAVLRAPAAGVADASEAWTLPEVRPPFGFYIFRGEAHDSLRREVETVNAEIRRLRSLQASRLRELARDLPADRSLVDRSDPELVRLQRAVTEVDRRAAALRDALDRAARREPGTPFSEPFGGWAPSGDPEPRAVRFRPLDPYLLGQNRAAGAEVVDLQPELAEYFQVEGGVLVVDVPAGTPAARAGIQPGDVVTNVGDLDVASIQELRQGLAATDSSIPVTVVRKGRRIQLLLPR